MHRSTIAMRGLNPIALADYVGTATRAPHVSPDPNAAITTGPFNSPAPANHSAAAIRSDAEDVFPYR